MNLQSQLSVCWCFWQGPDKHHWEHSACILMALSNMFEQSSKFDQFGSIWQLFRIFLSSPFWTSQSFAEATASAAHFCRPSLEGPSRACDDDDSGLRRAVKCRTVQRGCWEMLGDVGRCWEMLNAERCSWNFWEFIQLRFLFRVFQTQGISSRSRKRLTQEIQEIRLLWSAILLRRRSPLALVLLATLAWRPKRLMHADCDRVIDREVCGHLWTPKCETFKIWLSVKWKCGITLSLKFHRAMNETLKWECSQECWHLYWAACMAELLNSHAFPQRNILHDEMRFAKF